MKRSSVIKGLCLLWIGMLSFDPASGQQSFPSTPLFQPVQKELRYDSVHRIYIADTAGIQSLIRQFADKDLVVLISSSSGCGGTPGAIQYLNSLIPETLNVQYLFILSDPLKSWAAFPQFFAKLNEQIIRVLPAERYQAGRFLREDARKRGDDLLKATFPETKDDLAGTPKFYIVRPQTNTLLFHGFRNFQNPYPADVVRYFLTQVKP